MLVRLIGGLLIVAGILGIGLYLAKRLLPQPALPVEIIPCIVNLIPAALGLGVLIAAKSLAGWISNLLDD